MKAAALERVSKRFGELTALNRASFSVEEGEVVALLGPNGTCMFNRTALHWP
jgi:ABC-type multidrug transport system ATPase subunit